ncbi:hypothetical protein T484DRAFT_3120831, partial [Baffinella frigidus]
MIECVTPAALSPGTVAMEVSVDGGITFTSEEHSYLYETGALVESVRPSRGFMGEEGQTVTVVGQHFEPTQELRCRFGLSWSVHALHVSSSLVACNAPAGESGSMLVSVSLNGVDYSPSTARYVSSAPSSALALVPSLGPKSGGTTVRLTGLTGIAIEAVHLCVFDGQSVSALVSDGEVICTAPASASVGQVGVMVTDASGSDVAGMQLDYEYVAQPRISGLSPSRGSIIGGGMLSVYGGGFMDGGVQCRFGTGGSSPVAALMISSTVVKCLTPARTEPGAVRVEVSVNDGVDFTAGGLEYEYELEPIVESLSPSTGTSSTAGQVVTVVGQHFVASDTLFCYFGRGSPGGALYISSTMMTCTAPARSVGTVSVSISINGVERSQTSVVFEYASERRIGGLTPSRGPKSGGTAVTIGVAGSFKGGESVLCYFGSSSVWGAVQSDSSSVVCAAHGVKSVGTVKVRLADETGVAGILGEENYEYYSEPVVQRMYPSRGTVDGGTIVRVYGTGFSEAGLMCRFGDTVMGEDAAFFASSTEVSCVSPAGTAGSITVEVSVNGGADFTADGREYLLEAGAKVASVTPSHGIAGEGGQGVTVVGENFEQTGELSCRFGMSGTVHAQYVSSSLVVCTAPARGAGTVRVSVSLNGVDGGSTEGTFAYVQNVLVASVVPSEGAVTGGTSVVLRVSGLTATSDGVRCVFGQATAYGVMREDGSVECVSPSSKVAGKVTLKLEGYTGGATFTYFEAPTVASLRPSRGSLVGGASVSVTGSNLAGSLVQCRFGTTVVDGTSVRVVSSTAVVCYSPRMSAAGTVGVEVSVNGGADYTSDGREYLYQAGATVTRMQPSRGLA